MSTQDYFSDTYAEARTKFLAACETLGLKPQSIHHPDNGPAGEALYTDVVRVGPQSADKVFIVCAGTHGVEGFCGSGCFTGLLWKRQQVEARRLGTRGRRLPQGSARIDGPVVTRLTCLTPNVRSIAQ